MVSPLEMGIMENRMHFSNNREGYLRLDLKKQTAVGIQLGPGKCPVSQEEKVYEKFERQNLWVGGMHGPSAVM
jgi:hypothetical protein